MRIMTFSGFKGGTGKTTLAALVGVGAALDGRRVAALDLDRNTRNLADFLALRREAGLPAPDLVRMPDATARREQGQRLAPLAKLAAADGYDLLLIDTSSGNHDDIYEAHLLADIILTPMNYRDFIDSVRFDRMRAGLTPQTWHVCRNRVSALPTRVGDFVERQVRRLSRQAGFEGVWRVRDRVVHRSICIAGRTVFEAPETGRLTMSELSGRSEVRALLSLVDRGEPARAAS
jgi:cellulose biosynthesis protein BcsQ